MRISIKWLAQRRLLPWLMFATFILLAASLMPTIWRQESALQIRSSRQGVTLPDGFYVWQHLNAQGIRVKSITPDHDTLVIKLDSQEQSAAAQKALREMLPWGYEIAQMDTSANNNWFSRIGFDPQSVG